MDFQAFYKLSYGLYVVSTHNGSKFTGHVSNTFFQVTAEPAQAAICTAKENLTTEYIQKSKVFTVSVLEQDVDLMFIGDYGFKSGREVDKFAKANYKVGKTGAPILLDKTVAYFECEVVNEVDMGTHIMFIGKVLDAQIVDNTKPVLTYDHYRTVIKGVAPKTSPTFLSKDKLEQTAQKSEAKPAKDNPEKWARYQCVICGFIYDPVEGDPDSGIEPGTAFEDIPDGWMCPVCGVMKDDFVRIDD